MLSEFFQIRQIWRNLRPQNIAFEFGSWISPMFKLLLIKEFQRLKEIETNQYNLEWNVKRILTKTNYQIHTDAIKNHIIPERNYNKDTEWLIYAEEADLLNVALFNCTAKDWREANKEHAEKGLSIRDFTSINELGFQDGNGRTARLLEKWFLLQKIGQTAARKSFTVATRNVRRKLKKALDCTD